MVLNEDEEEWLNFQKPKADNIFHSKLDPNLSLENRLKLAEVVDELKFLLWKKRALLTQFNINRKF